MRSISAFQFFSFIAAGLVPYLGSITVITRPAALVAAVVIHAASIRPPSSR
jgi:hypothetical protein